MPCLYNSQLGNKELYNLCSFSFYAIAIEDDYLGPKLENGKVTKTFMEDLMKTYTDQKKLHRKYAYQVC